MLCQDLTLQYTSHTSIRCSFSSYKLSLYNSSDAPIVLVHEVLGFYFIIILHSTSLTLLLVDMPVAQTAAWQTILKNSLEIYMGSIYHEWLIMLRKTAARRQHSTHLHWGAWQRLNIQFFVQLVAIKMSFMRSKTGTVTAALHGIEIDTAHKL